MSLLGLVNGLVLSVGFWAVVIKLALIALR